MLTSSFRAKCRNVFTFVVKELAQKRGGLQLLPLIRTLSFVVVLQAVWLVTFLATVLLDVDLGLMVGVIFALLTVIIRSQK